MKTWQIVILSILAIYGIGFLVALAYTRGQVKISLLWFFFVLWAIMGGNIQ